MSGMCDDDACTTCSLTYYPTTDYYLDQEASLFSHNVKDEMTTTDDDVIQVNCCSAGVLLNDENLIEACLMDDGSPDDELEWTDTNPGECIKRSIQNMHYVDGVTPVVGYEDKDKRVVLTTTILANGDECCQLGCDGTTSFLAACADNSENAGDKTYSISDDDFYCLESQSIDTVFYFADNSEACTVTSSIVKSNEFAVDEVPDNACCVAAVADT